MQEIRCPNCGQVFQVDESGYAKIAQQVRDEEFRKELSHREEALAEALKSRLELAKTVQEKEYQEALSQKDAALSALKAQIVQLQAQIDGGRTEKDLAVSEAVRTQEQIREKAVRQKDDELAQRDRTIQQLRSQIDNSQTAQALAVSQAVQAKERELADGRTEITALQGRLSAAEAERQLQETALREQYEEKLRSKDEQIGYYKDFKARQSTKMIGESLEQHCLTEFNTIRMAAFPAAYFEKDNDARTGSKGDFIFRESAPDGTEFISIMFEMKNEADQTATKHKNEDFFKELDKDRREKKCEYAVLVSLLEIDNDLYNNGIVDVSYRYEKMYVIRPQFFIPIITLLRNAALNSLQYRQELQAVREQQLDVLHFEENMNAFKDGFARNFRIASDRFHTAIDEIDKTIQHLQKTKDALLSSENNLRLANNKADDLTIKKLTKNAPSVRTLLEEQRAKRDGE
ncbi:DUF2130 domain-containing protein [Pseudoflavonifractor sp. MSJ-37]|nr:DUF2130 domain-containing protein [Pseudoflavonifractor sp. MSJ-37]